MPAVPSRLYAHRRAVVNVPPGRSREVAAAFAEGEKLAQN